MKMKHLFLALAVFTRSPAAYEALKSFKLLQLPSVRLLKHYIDSNLEEAGECLKRLEEEGKCYQAKVKQLLANQNGIIIILAICQASNFCITFLVTSSGCNVHGVKLPKGPIPTGDGVLIIDEVKVRRLPQNVVAI
jgi:hypothetical protein